MSSSSTQTSLQTSYRLYRGPIEIVDIDRPDIVKFRDLTTEEVLVVHTSKLRLFRHLLK